MENQNKTVSNVPTIMLRDRNTTYVIGLNFSRSSRETYASCRGIHEKFRQDVAGAEKSFGFAHRGTDKQLMVFEAPIDLLSFIELFPKNWQQHS